MRLAKQPHAHPGKPHMEGLTKHSLCWMQGCADRRILSHLL